MVQRKREQLTLQIKDSQGILACLPFIHAGYPSLDLPTCIYCVQGVARDFFPEIVFRGVLVVTLVVGGGGGAISILFK